MQRPDILRNAESVGFAYHERFDAFHVQPVGVIRDFALDERRE